jgi:hypothetical protein
MLLKTSSVYTDINLSFLRKYGPGGLLFVVDDHAKFPGMPGVIIE